MTTHYSAHYAYDDECPVDIGMVEMRMENEPCLALIEEFGYHDWIWFPPFPIEELESRWVSMPSVEFAVKEFLGGDWYEMAHSNYRLIKIGKWKQHQFLSHEQYLLFRLIRPDRYSGHICCDNDSYIRKPDGTRLYHAGYTGEVTDAETSVRKHEEWRIWWKKHHLQVVATLPLKRVKGMPKRRAKPRAHKK